MQLMHPRSGRVAAALFMAATALPASAATLSRSVEVKGSAAAVWAAIGPFCAIETWHPAIGACTLDGKAPPTRTLTTKDGKARFVELQTTRSDAGHSYSYTFTSSPVPVTRYSSTLQVAPKGPDRAVITWSSDYTPEAGKEKDALSALSGIYESGLAVLKTRWGG